MGVLGALIEKRINLAHRRLKIVRATWRAEIAANRFQSLARRHLDTAALRLRN
jgi:hypothetical protein